jgi:hypothetical protein
MIRTAWRCGAVAAFALFAGAAHAATITRSYGFTFTDFEILGGGDPVPQDTVSGAFTVTFDTAVKVDNVTSGLVVDSLDTPVDGGVFAFSWDPVQGVLRFGGITSPGDTVDGFVSGSNDFGLSWFDDVWGPPTGETAAYTRAAFPDSIWFSQTASIEAATAAVPEPSTWALAILGCGGTGVALRRARRRQAVIVAVGRRKG